MPFQFIYDDGNGHVLNEHGDDAMDIVAAEDVKMEVEGITSFDDHRQHMQQQIAPVPETDMKPEQPSKQQNRTLKKRRALFI
ncbi:hypothetical protein DM01DRAFT_1394129 [Hesseltinella vesiculosa]|uniref:Uncharacterized protein n=1 Tax=Hesseltinella vesiculosa TaxID=101127 RepID=A0A1X2GBK5_9FUNG|nr:hypothetical protein DM01DRAFT_1394129 [Hesseltinella vesiculosa]